MKSCQILKTTRKPYKVHSWIRNDCKNGSCQITLSLKRFNSVFNFHHSTWIALKTIKKSWILVVVVGNFLKCCEQSCHYTILGVPLISVFEQSVFQKAIFIHVNIRIRSFKLIRKHTQSIATNESIFPKYLLICHRKKSKFQKKKFNPFELDKC